MRILGRTRPAAGGRRAVEGVRTRRCCAQTSSRWRTRWRRSSRRCSRASAPCTPPSSVSMRCAGPAAPGGRPHRRRARAHAAGATRLTRGPFHVVSREPFCLRNVCGPCGAIIAPKPFGLGARHAPSETAVPPVVLRRHTHAGRPTAGFCAAQRAAPKDAALPKDDARVGAASASPSEGAEGEAECQIGRLEWYFRPCPRVSATLPLLLPKGLLCGCPQAGDRRQQPPRVPHLRMRSRGGVGRRAAGGRRRRRRRRRRREVDLHPPDPCGVRGGD